MNKTKLYVIKDDETSCGFHPNFFFGCNSLKYRVSFNENCLFYFSDNFVNRLFGITYGLHSMQESVNFGWNVDVYRKNIEIFAVCYKLGKCYTQKLTTISANVDYLFEVKTFEAFYQLRIVNINKEIIGWANIQKPKTVNCGYKLFPRLGGKRMAFDDMCIKMTKQ
jgi:hypothetical protein